MGGILIKKILWGFWWIVKEMEKALEIVSNSAITFFYQFWNQFHSKRLFVKSANVYILCSLQIHGSIVLMNRHCFTPFFCINRSYWIIYSCTGIECFIFFSIKDFLLIMKNIIWPNENLLYSFNMTVMRIIANMFLNIPSSLWFFNEFICFCTISC